MTRSMLAKKICEIGRRLYEHGMISWSDGNISARTEDDMIMITPSGVCKGKMEPDDMVMIDREGRSPGGVHKPSSETEMHVHIYGARADIRAIVHAHAPHATAFAVAGIDISQPVLPEVALFVGPIALTPFASPGTDQVGKALDPFLANHDAFLLKNHGVITLSENLEDAYNMMETVEHYARILYMAKTLGNIDYLDKEEAERLHKLRLEMKSKREKQAPV